MRMRIEGLGSAFPIKDFVLGGVRGSSAWSGSHGLCHFSGSCFADIDVTRSADRVSAKLMRACVTGKNFPFGTLSVINLNDNGTNYIVRLTDVKVVAAVGGGRKSDEKISFICSGVDVGYG